jgi:membrane protease YdiL (CAAX protease family)
MTNPLEQPTPQSGPRRIAPLWHTLGLLALLLAVSAGFFRMQSADPADPNIGGGPHGNIPLYLAIIGAEWCLVLYIWLGGRCEGAVPLRELIGGRWAGLRAVMADFGVAAGFWAVWTLAAIGMNLLLRPSHAATAGFLNPRGAAEVTLWVAMSMTAGFCEEVVYRGYVQRQALALTGSAALAVGVQAVLFGAGHWYQGRKQVILITGLGLLFGILARWRRSLRPGMISHAWSDILNVIPLHLP